MATIDTIKTILEENLDIDPNTVEESSTFDSLGIDSLEDILEEIVGEISDESDAVESAYTKLDDRNYLFDGKTHIGDFERILQLPENTFADVKGEAETLAGLMLEIKRDFLKKGDVVTTHDLRFTAHTIEVRRIDKVQVTLPE